MAVAVALDNAIPNAIDKTQQNFIVQGTLTLSGNYAQHGDVMNLSGLCPGNLPPTRVEVYEEPAAGEAPLGYTFLYAKGTTIANGLLVVLTGGGVEIVTGAYDAALTAATANIKFRAWIPMFV